MFKDSDKFIRLALPKVVKIIVNIVSQGPRMLVRSAVTVLRANMATRILSAFSLLILDIVDLKRKRISKTQFFRNILMSAMLVLSGTFGWYFGVEWLAFEFISAGIAEIVGGILGTGIMVGVAGKLFDLIGNRIHTPDQDKMREILCTCCEHLKCNKDDVLAKINTSDLKRLYAADDREACAKEIVNKHHP